MDKSYISLDKVVGAKTSEADVGYALGRARSPGGNRPFRKRGAINDNDFPNDDKRKLRLDISDIDDEDLVIEYTPIKFSKRLNATKSEAFIESVTSTEPRKYYASIPLKINNESPI